MPIRGSWCRLTLDAIERVPEQAGVYELATLVRTSVLMRRTSGRGLRGCLLKELTAPRSQINRRDLYFRYEQTTREDDRLEELLREYARSHRGKTPPRSGGREA